MNVFDLTEFHQNSNPFPIKMFDKLYFRYIFLKYFLLEDLFFRCFSSRGALVISN